MIEPRDDKHARQLAAQRLYCATHREELRQRDRTQRLANPEKAKARDAADRLKYREKRNAQSRAWRLAHPGRQAELSKAWHESHPEEDAAYDKEYREAHAQEIAEREREYNRANRVKISAAQNARRQAHPEIVLTMNQRRRARKASAAINDLTHAQWVEIQAAFNHCCAYCGKRAKGHLTQDHITPLAKGGNHTVSNVAPACGLCNSRKGTRNVPVPVQPLLLTLA